MRQAKSVARFLPNGQLFGESSNDRRVVDFRRFKYLQRETILGGKAWSRWVSSSGISENLMRAVHFPSKGCRGPGFLPS